MAAKYRSYMVRDKEKIIEYTEQTTVKLKGGTESQRSVLGTGRKPRHKASGLVWLRAREILVVVIKCLPHLAAWVQQHRDYARPNLNCK